MDEQTSEDISLVIDTIYKISKDVINIIKEKQSNKQLVNEALKDYIKVLNGALKYIVMQQKNQTNNNTIEKELD